MTSSSSYRAEDAPSDDDEPVITVIPEVSSQIQRNADAMVRSLLLLANNNNNSISPAVPEISWWRGGNESSQFHCFDASPSTAPPNTTTAAAAPLMITWHGPNTIETVSTASSLSDTANASSLSLSTTTAKRKREPVLMQSRELAMLEFGEPSPKRFCGEQRTNPAAAFDTFALSTKRRRLDDYSGGAMMGGGYSTPAAAAMTAPSEQVTHCDSPLRPMAGAAFPSVGDQTATTSRKRLR